MLSKRSLGIEQVTCSWTNNREINVMEKWMILYIIFDSEVIRFLRMPLVSSSQMIPSSCRKFRKCGVDNGIPILDCVTGLCKEGNVEGSKTTMEADYW